MKFEYGALAVATILFNILEKGSAIQCYQCDSNEDGSCQANRYFDKTINALVDCNSFEARIPGTFCMKVTQESPGWGGWVKQTRRCGSMSDIGVAWGCRFWYEENGVWKEVCYCDDADGCNGSSTLSRSLPLLFLAPLLALLAYLRQ